MFSEPEAYQQRFSRCLLLDLLESVIFKKPAQQAKVVKAAAGNGIGTLPPPLPRSGLGLTGNRLGSAQSLIERFCQDVGLWVVKAEG
jgi:hypothetical protein